MENCKADIQKLLEIGQGLSINSCSVDVSTIKSPLLKQQIYLKIPRISHQRCSRKKGVRRNFAKFTGKHLCQSLFFKPQACNFIKKETLAQVFSCEFCETSKNTFFTEHLWATASECLQYVRCRSSVWNFPVVSFFKIFFIWKTYFQEHLRVFFIHFFLLSFLTAMCQARIYSLCFCLFLQKIRRPVLFSTS